MWSTPGSAPVTASIPDTIGDTPLVRLRRVVPDGAAHVFVKVEGGNPTGSYKVGYAGLGREILAQTRDSGPGWTPSVRPSAPPAWWSSGERPSFRWQRGTCRRPGTGDVADAHGRAAGPHRVEGTATGIVPPLLTSGSFDEARTVDEADTRRLARRLARQEGLFVGTSSALDIVGAIQLAGELVSRSGRSTRPPRTGSGSTRCPPSVT
jgi:cysteine synthase